MTNRLEREKSPYLKQHAANPVDWYPWGDEAFAKAQAEDKPIFLSIGYSSCHWCHVMARESFSDAEVAAVVNERFVAVKVDREERPDIDALYMTACQALGNPGGWPLSVFLTPSGKPFFAGTYFPKRARGATPGFIELVSSIARLWQADRARIDATGDQLAEHLRGQAAPAGQSSPDEGIFAAVYTALRNQFDDRYGGFGQAPKFPVPHRLSFLLSYHRSTGNDAALRMAAETLRHMRHGGMFDQIGLGFHRYSVDERWRVPHFEKMLADQALCARAYIEAFLVTRDPFYARTAHEIFAYVLRDMTADTGGFYTAQDAESGSEEGATYLFTTDEIRRVLKDGEADLAVEYFGIKREGNIPASGFADGMNIPYVPVEPEQVAARRGMETATLLDAVESIRQRLLSARGKRPQPGTDDKRITAVNGLMIGGLALGYRALGEPAYLTAAERAARFVLERLSDGSGGLLRRFREDTAGIGGFLDDYAFFIRGLIDLYEASLDVEFLERALALSRVMLARFEDPRGGGLFTAPRDGERLIADVKDVLDGAGPSPNAVAAENLLRLAALSGDTGFFDAAEAILKAVWPLVSAHPEASTGYMAAYRRYIGPTSQIVIVGTPGSPSTREMVETVHALFLPAASLLFVPQRGRARRRVEEIAPFVSGMEPAGGRAAAYVCRDTTCREPLTDPDSVRAALLGVV